MGGDLRICQDCPAYTDQSKYIHIRSGDFQAELFLDRLVDLPIYKLHKLFRFTLSAARDNAAAIAALDAYLPGAAQEAEHQHMRWVKIHALWNDTKHKMNIK